VMARAFFYWVARHFFIFYGNGLILRKISMIRDRSFLPRFFIGTSLFMWAANADAVTIWSELVNGDLSSSQSNATALGTLSLGNNSLYLDDSGSLYDRDYFTFTVPRMDKKLPRGGACWEAELIESVDLSRAENRHAQTVHPVRGVSVLGLESLSLTTLSQLIPRSPRVKSVRAFPHST